MLFRSFALFLVFFFIFFSSLFRCRCCFVNSLNPPISHSIIVSNIFYFCSKATVGFAVRRSFLIPLPALQLPCRDSTASRFRAGEMAIAGVINMVIFHLPGAYTNLSRNWSVRISSSVLFFHLLKLLHTFRSAALTPRQHLEFW